MIETGRRGAMDGPVQDQVPRRPISAREELEVAAAQEALGCPSQNEISNTGMSKRPMTRISALRDAV